MKTLMKFILYDDMNKVYIKCTLIKYLTIPMMIHFCELTSRNLTIKPYRLKVAADLMQNK